MKKVVFVVAMVMALAWSVCAWAEFKDGLWEITSQVQMQGMPQKMPPTTFRQCMTRNDPVPKNQDKNYQCKTISQSVSGNTVSYTAECNAPEGKMTVTGKSTYTGGSMDGTATMSFRMKGQPAMVMNSRMTGKYLGACK